MMRLALLLLLLPTTALARTTSRLFSTFDTVAAAYLDAARAVEGCEAAAAANAVHNCELVLPFVSFPTSQLSDYSDSCVEPLGVATTFASALARGGYRSRAAVPGLNVTVWTMSNSAGIYTPMGVAIPSGATLLQNAVDSDPAAKHSWLCTCHSSRPRVA